MPADKEDREAARVLREIERRIVWGLVAFTAMIIKENPAETADYVLEEYESRFPAIQPPD